MQQGSRRRLTVQKPAGFTLIELMIGIVLLAILVSIALPSYQDYIRKSRDRTAAADLAALATNLELIYQRQLNYPEIDESTTTGIRDALPNEHGEGILAGWSPASDDYFNFSLKSVGTDYEATASGQRDRAGCVLTLNDKNDRGSVGCEGDGPW